MPRILIQLCRHYDKILITSSSRDWTLISFVSNCISKNDLDAQHALHHDHPSLRSSFPLYPQQGSVVYSRHLSRHVYQLASLTPAARHERGLEPLHLALVSRGLDLLQSWLSSTSTIRLTASMARPLHLPIRSPPYPPSRFSTISLSSLPSLWAQINPIWSPLTTFFPQTAEETL